MKKKLAVIMMALMTIVAALSFSGCQKKEKADSDKIGIIQLVENGAFNDMRDGIIEELKANGYTNIDVKCAQGDASTIQTIAQGMADGSYKAVFTIATPSTQAMVNQECDTPIFFCSVSAPVAAGVLSDMAHPDKNATGTSNAIPISDIFAFSNKLTPDAETYGFLYSLNEVNSVNTINSAKEYCDTNNIPYKEVTVTNSSEVMQAAQTLAESVDAIFIPNDSVIQSAMTTVTEVAREKKIPVYGSSATMVVSGAFATIAISDVEIGKLTAQMGLKYLKDGVKVADIPSVVVPATQTVINEDTLKALGIELPAEVTEKATFIKDAQ